MNRPSSMLSRSLLCPGAPHSRQRGIALVFVLIMMSIATSVALISARTTLLSERTARNDRDRQIAFQAAEMALNDAELDIMDPASDRGCKFGNPNTAMAIVAGEGCSGGTDTRGFCKSTGGDIPLYKQVDWNDTTGTRTYVNYGEFTGRSDTLQTAAGGGPPGAPAQRPKYIIEQTQFPTAIPFAGNRVLSTTTAYRVFALGYGASVDGNVPASQVMLEAVIVKPALAKTCSSGATL
jgi:type IV pilus assembly protein PilX